MRDGPIIENKRENEAGSTLTTLGHTSRRHRPGPSDVRERWHGFHVIIDAD